jgi:hypothetical protein
MQAGAKTTYSILYVPYDLKYNPAEVQPIISGMDTEILTKDEMKTIWTFEVIIFMFIMLWQYFKFLIPSQ